MNRWEHKGLKVWNLRMGPILGYGYGLSNPHGRANACALQSICSYHWTLVPIYWTNRPIPIYSHTVLFIKFIVLSSSQINHTTLLISTTTMHAASVGSSHFLPQSHDLCSHKQHT